MHIGGFSWGKGGFWEELGDVMRSDVEARMDGWMDGWTDGWTDELYLAKREGFSSWRSGAGAEQQQQQEKGTIC